MAPRWSFLGLVPTAAAFKSMQNATAGNLDPNRILCPVLASLWNNGDLKTDEFGIAERMDIHSALKDGTGVSEDFAEFQSDGIADYDWTHKLDQSSRDRCAPGFSASGTACFAKYLANKKNYGLDVERYLNIFQMNGNENVEHGFSTGVRGGNCNSRAQNDVCNGQYPCQALFDKFYAAFADSRGRLYREQILKIICHTMKEGDRSGEFSYADASVPIPFIDVKLPARQWQMKGAMQGWLSAFGRVDENNELYLDIEDARQMLMEGRLPDGWQKRRWGCVTQIGGCPKMPNGHRDTGLLDQATAELPCDEEQEWWGGDERTTTGEGCSKDSDCTDQHALCLSKRCTCGKGRNGRQMLFTASSKCEEQTHTHKYFGESCQYTRANHPDSPSVWSSSIEV